MTNKVIKKDSNTKPKRDWLTMIVGAVIGLLIAIATTWYQLNAADKEAAEAELERLQSAKNTIIAIVEEQVLHGIGIDQVRINRLIEQRRREQKISLPITINDIVEKAEFNIASSHHLPIQRKEEIKNLFGKFHEEVSNLNYENLPLNGINSIIYNEIAEYIRNGKTKDALEALVKLNKKNQELYDFVEKSSKPTLVDAVFRFFSSWWNITIFLIVYIVLLILIQILRVWITNRNYNVVRSL